MFCPKCGSELPENAAFCGKCGHQLATNRVGAAASPSAAMAAFAAASPTSAGAAPAGVSVMSIVRIAIAVVLFALLLMPWVEYNGAITGASQFNFSEMASWYEKGWILTFPMYAGLIVVVAGVLIDLVSKRTFGRWLCLVGCILVILIALLSPQLIVADSGNSVSLFGYTVASLAPTVVPWLSAILALVGAVTCFIKR